MVEGKVVAITGASSGIGKATAIELARLGAKLLLGARREEALCKLLKKSALPEARPCTAFRM